MWSFGFLYGVSLGKLMNKQLNCSLLETPHDVIEKFRRLFDTTYAVAANLLQSLSDAYMRQ